MTDNTRPATPRFTGVDTFFDHKGRYQFRFPSDWARYELEGHPEGVIFSPNHGQEFPQTFVSGYAVPLDVKVVAEDLEVLGPAIRDGLGQLADMSIEHEADDTYGNLIKFDRTFTFRDGDATRKRHTWIMYVADIQIVFTYQGESPAEYDYWLPMGNTMFYHVQIPESFWFATDRDLNQTGDEKTSKTKRGRR